ncbi:MAG: prephenate dehydrogenase, partial [Eubacteriales bacterium]
KVAGFDIDQPVLNTALEQGVVDSGNAEDVCASDVVFVCLFPEAAVEFISSHTFSHIVCDVCGVKGFVSEQLSGRVPGYVGVHPMAGREISGYYAGDADLFLGASLIITADGNTNKEYVQRIKEFAPAIGFERVVVTTPEKHDRIIAYTSQLAHVVSSSYVKSDTAMDYVGFSAGSFSDLTRVARLDPQMWAQLFLENSKNLSEEIDTLVGHLLEYKKAIAEGNRQELLLLLSQGRERKDLLDKLKE